MDNAIMHAPFSWDCLVHVRYHALPALGLVFSPLIWLVAPPILRLLLPLWRNTSTPIVSGNRGTHGVSADLYYTYVEACTNLFGLLISRLLSCAVCIARCLLHLSSHTMLPLYLNSHYGCR